METRNLAKELRIGNLVCYRDKDWIPLFVSNIGNTFETVSSDNILYGSDDIDEYNPIPLTEEWLLKFGFKKFGTEFTNKSKFWIDEGNAIWKNSTIGEVKYVHQLQNVYFALTGEELEINLTQE